MNFNCAICHSPIDSAFVIRRIPLDCSSSPDHEYLIYLNSSGIKYENIKVSKIGKFKFYAERWPEYTAYFEIWGKSSLSHFDEYQSTEEVIKTLIKLERTLVLK